VQGSTVLAASERRPYGINDDGFTHGPVLL